MNDKTEQAEEHQGDNKGRSETFWESTRKTLHATAFRANKYKRIAQKKIDLNSLHKKIAATHADLGKMVDDLRERGEADILANEEVLSLFQILDGLKHAAAADEEEIEAIKAEEPSEEEPSSGEGVEKKH